jgi:Mono-functional DNA-alkylating methyl methanesulfonate N-term
MLRYLFATEAGELYILFIDLNMLGHDGGDVNLVKGTHFEQSKFINIEFLGGNLTNSSSLQYLDEGYLFYGSRDGESFLLKMQAGNQKNRDQPYI